MMYKEHTTLKRHEYINISNMLVFGGTSGVCISFLVSCATFIGVSSYLSVVVRGVPEKVLYLAG